MQTSEPVKVIVDRKLYQFDPIHAFLTQIQPFYAIYSSWRVARATQKMPNKSAALSGIEPQPNPKGEGSPLDEKCDTARAPKNAAITKKASLRVPQSGTIASDRAKHELWLRKAAQLGSDEAKFRLAKMLSNGNGVAKDLEESFDLYQELMFDCNVDAMIEVGIALKEGRGVPKDEELGSKYMRFAFDIELDLMKDEPDAENP